MPASPERYVRRRPVREEHMDDVLFLVDEEGKAIHMIETMSIGLWRLLQEPVSRAEAKSIIKQAFPGVSARRIASDVDDLFEDLMDAGLITRAD